MRVDGIGPQPCDILICGEGPGYWESKEGKPFVGKTGDELDCYLDGVDLPTRDEVYLTNIFREYGGRDYVWTAADLERDEPFVIHELQQIQPKLIVTLGRYAVRFFLGDVDLDSTQGIPWVLPTTDKLAFLGNECIILPIIHPAAGMHNPELSPYIVSGFQQLSSFLAGKLDPHVLFADPYLGKEVYRLLEGDEVCHVLCGL